MEKSQVLWTAANEFAEKTRKLPTILEVAVVGSVAGGDPYPDDLDTAVIVRDFEEIEILAKYARQMTRYYHGWEVFLFSEDLSPLDRICHRRECPGRAVDCAVPGCGQPPHVRVVPDFRYDERVFLTSPIHVLWTDSEMSRLLTRKEQMGITETQTYPILEDVEITCIFCGKRFVFTAGEQKWYQKRGLSQPKRCPDCIERRHMGDSDTGRAPSPM